MDPLVLGSAIGSAGNTAGNIASTILTNRANMKLAQYGYEQERQMIAEQNAYNSPVEQMKRYQDAGLNPALIYGNGASSAGNQQSIAHYNAPSLDAPKIDLNNVIPALLNAQKEMASIENIKEQNFILKMQQSILGQDFYQKQMDNAVRADLLGMPISPFVDDDDLESFRNSPMYKQRMAESENVVLQNDILKVQKEFNTLKKEEQKFINDNMLDLQLKYQQHLNKFEKAHAEIEEVDASFEKRLMEMGMSGKGANLLIQLFRMFIKGR